MKPLNYEREAEKSGSKSRYGGQQEWSCTPLSGTSLTEKGEFLIGNTGAHAPEWREGMYRKFGLLICKPKDMPRRIVTDTGEHIKTAWFNTEQWLMYDLEYNRVVSTYGGIRYKYTTEHPIPNKKIVTLRPDRGAFKAKWTSEPIVELRAMCKTLILLEPEAYTNENTGYRWSRGMGEPKREVMLTLLAHPDLLDTTKPAHRAVVAYVNSAKFEAYGRRTSMDKRQYNYLQLEV